MKITVVGIGRVGSTLAYTIALRGLADELVLLNRSPAVAEGDAADLQHALSFTPRPMRIRAGAIDDAAAAAGSDVVCLTVSARLAADDRLAYGPQNAAVFGRVVPPLAAASPGAVFLVVSNPVDVLTGLTLRLTGAPAERVFGTGTLIDSARFRFLLGRRLGIHPDDVRAYIVGEHGASQFPLLGAATAGGEPLAATPGIDGLFRQAVASGTAVHRAKGYTNYAIALCAGLVLDAIVHDTRRTMPLSVRLDDYQGVGGVCLSVPVVVGRGGVHRILRPDFTEGERELFHASAAAVRRAMRAAGMDADS